MTHDDLLIEINRRLDVAYYNGDPQSMRALRAVVELHKPMKEPKKSGWFEGVEYKEGYVIGCEFDNYHYPCPTIQAIEGQLK